MWLQLWEYRDDPNAVAELLSIFSSYIMPALKAGECFPANLIFIYDMVARLVFIPAPGVCFCPCYIMDG